MVGVFTIKTKPQLHPLLKQNPNCIHYSNQTQTAGGDAFRRAWNEPFGQTLFPLTPPLEAGPSPGALGCEAGLYLPEAGLSLPEAGLSLGSGAGTSLGVGTVDSEAGSSQLPCSQVGFGSEGRRSPEAPQSMGPDTSRCFDLGETHVELASEARRSLGAGAVEHAKRLWDVRMTALRKANGGQVFPIPSLW